jgi:SOS response regulatory protein OraA/RecX
MEKDPLYLALRKLTGRSYSVSEIRNFLHSLGCNEDIINDCQEKLQKWGYLNDRALGERVFQQYTESKPCGRIYLLNKLNLRLLPQEIIDSIMVNYDDDLELKLAFVLAKTYLQQRGRVSMPAWELMPPLARFLKRRGFSGFTIGKIINLISDDAFPFSEEADHSLDS